MPVIEQELTNISESKGFAAFDLSQGYWKLFLEPSSHAFQPFITPDDIYSSTEYCIATLMQFFTYSLT